MNELFNAAQADLTMLVYSVSSLCIHFKIMHSDSDILSMYPIKKTFF